jgi:arylsulfatase A-like enzyme
MCNTKILLSASTFLLASGHLLAAEKNHPNIIFIFTDDHATQAISAYGGIFKDIAPTPNIDRLAKEGALLNNVFCTNAISGPSRACVLTGKYSHVNGYYKNEGCGIFNSKQWTFPQELKKNGYQTALFGKWHLGSEPKGFDSYKYHNDHGQQGCYWNPVFNENGKDVIEKGYATNLTTDFALNWLTENKNSKAPFCVLLQYKAPHREWSPDSIYQHTFDNMEMPYPKTFNDDYKGREKTIGDTWATMAFLNRYDMKLTPPENLKGKELEDWLVYGNKPGENFAPKPGMSLEEIKKWKYQRYIKDYLACIKSVDDNIGRVFAYLKDNNLDKNTIVIYSSDQGFYLGEHGLFDKRFMYEESLRMPFLIRYPEKIKPGSVCNDIITNVDFAPTLLEMAGIKAPKEVQGKSFFSNLQGKTPINWQKSMYYHYYEFPFWHHVQPHYGIRNDRYKLIHFYFNVDLWEFYDLKTDPNEINNSIDNPKFTSIIAKMKKELKALMIKNGNYKSLEDFRKISDTNFGRLKTK